MNQFKLYLKVFGITIGAFVAYYLLMDSLFSDYESQTPGLYEKMYPSETHGYDLSHHNKDVKWNKLSNAQFVYLKATEGTWFKDPH